MSDRFLVQPMIAIGPELSNLADAAAAEGFGFMAGMITAWDKGINRFDQPGEAYFGIWLRTELVAAGGLNRDPYLDDPQVGRVRHVYVMPQARRMGAGTLLMDAIIAAARARFSLLRLRTTTSRGRAFYEALGFERADWSDASHQMPLQRDAPEAMSGSSA